jgi:hypothetical protein
MKIQDNQSKHEEAGIVHGDLEVQHGPIDAEPIESEEEEVIRARIEWKLMFLKVYAADLAYLFLFLYVLCVFYYK